MADTFYDNTPFEYGYSSKEEILENMNPHLKEIIIENKDKIICDIGCGCGRNLVFTSKYASKLIGVDLSEESLEFANHCASKIIQVYGAKFNNSSDYAKLIK